MSRYGGEHTIGTITRAQADYWIERDDDKLMSYITDWEEHTDVPTKYQIGNWYEIDELLHLNSVEYSDANLLTIDGITTPSIEVELGDMELVSDREDVMACGADGLFLNKSLNDANKVVCYGQSWDKGSWDYGKLEIDHIVDISKFRYDISLWDNIWIVNGLSYGDVSLDNQGGDSMGKSMTFWIED